MVGTKTGVATHINEIESHAHLTHYQGHAFETIKAIKIMRGTLDVSFELNALFKYSLKRQEASNRLRDTAPGNSGDTTLCSNCWMVTEILLQSILDN